MAYLAILRLNYFGFFRQSSLFFKFFYMYFLFMMFCPNFVASSEKILFYHNDAIGTPIAITDESGDVVWTADYKPFGEANVISETLPNKKQFSGKDLDSETGFHYFGARFYDAELGRFLSPDNALLDGRPKSALLNRQRHNFYSYAANNPLRYIDPDGKYEVESEKLKGSRLFNRALKLIHRSREGKRLLGSLAEADGEIEITDHNFYVNDLALKNASLVGFKYLRLGRSTPLYSYLDQKSLILIDIDIIFSQFKGRRRLRVLTETIFHELRHAEADLYPFDGNTDSIHTALDQYKRPSLDSSLRQFEKELKSLMRRNR